MRPSSDNQYLKNHIELLFTSYRYLTGRDLIDRGSNNKLDYAEVAEMIFNAPFVVLSHNNNADPILSYGNLTAMKLFELGWDEFVSTPSKLTAEAPNREERQRLLDEVANKGYIDNYSGIRISSTGKRFMIERATVWNLIDEAGVFRGQAATFAEWKNL